jgi:hypothetical protein
VSIYQLTAQKSSLPSRRASAPRRRVRAVSKGFFAQTMVAAVALVTVTINTKPLSRFVPERGAR